ncbi:hypothetical protein ABZ896_33440 [Streptomyces sp. NPDC047072]|uniref:hypothetical protein n=1 Tax=Streptomyces sp. NPDC047072 TaxID=3154809 RepID=UPI0034087E06
MPQEVTDVLGLLTDEFAGVGPLGFVLGRKQWLERYRKGLENRAFSVEEPDVRAYARLHIGATL